MLKRYFLNGEKEGYLGTIILFPLTSIDSATTARAVCESRFFGDTRACSEVLRDYILRPDRFEASMPWYRQQVQWFVERVLGHEYRVVTVKFKDVDAR